MEKEKKPRATPEETTLHFIEWKCKRQWGQREFHPNANHYFEWDKWRQEFKQLRNQKERMERAEAKVRLYEKYLDDIGGMGYFRDWCEEHKL